jgi:hypothetical protein
MLFMLVMLPFLYAICLWMFHHQRKTFIELKKTKLPRRQSRGFMIVKKITDVLAEFNGRDMSAEQKEQIQKIRIAFSSINSSCYRGIYRDPLSAWTDANEKDPLAATDEQCARKKFRTINGIDRSSWNVIATAEYYNIELIDTLEDAREIFSRLEHPEQYEIVEVSCDGAGCEYQLLGYDIACWGGDHLSLVCDTAVMPQWHPPHETDLEELKKELSVLNEHLLFPTKESALRFRAYYLQKPWAEKETFTGQFCAIRITRVI